MTAADWGLVVPTKGSAITSYRTPFAALAESVATGLDTVKSYSFPRYAKRSDLPSQNIVQRQHATVYADPTASNNGDYYWNGTSWVNLLPLVQKSQSFAFRSNAAGEITVTHQLGVEPAFIAITWFGDAGANAWDFRVVSKSSANFVVRIHYNGTAWTNQSLTGSNGILWKIEA